MTIEFVDVGTERLEVLRLAPERSGTTLVFLHEGLGSVAGWRGFPRTLCDRLTAPGLVYSRRGYGRSTPLAESRATDYLHREAWDVLPALLERCGVRRPRGRSGLHPRRPQSPAGLTAGPEAPFGPACDQKNACSPVCARPRISAWTSCVPS